jgi:hypothetical protein
MKKVLITNFMVVVCMFVLTGAIGRANDDDRRAQREFRADLRGHNEVPLTLSGAHGELLLTIAEDDLSVHFVLKYEGLLTSVLFSHIHVGQPNVNGGVTVFFCGGGGRPPCAQGGGTVEGDFTAADVIGLTSQQLSANDLASLLKAIRARETYANLHTTTSPGGEIRGAIVAVQDRDRDRDKH